MRCEPGLSTLIGGMAGLVTGRFRYLRIAAGQPDRKLDLTKWLEAVGLVRERKA